MQAANYEDRQWKISMLLLLSFLVIVFAFSWTKFLGLRLLSSINYLVVCNQNRGVSIEWACLHFQNCIEMIASVYAIVAVSI